MNTSTIGKLMTQYMKMIVAIVEMKIVGTLQLLEQLENRSWTHFSEDLQGHGSKATAGERKKDYTHFYFHSCPICLATFLFLHGIGKKRFRNLVKHYKLNGVSARMHGNRKRKPWNAAHFEDKELAVTFITNYAEVHALPLPGRMPRFKDYNIMLLPSVTTKASVYREYVSRSEDIRKTSGEFVRYFGYHNASS